MISAVDVLTALAASLHGKVATTTHDWLQTSKEFENLDRSFGSSPASI
jgi:hypothetical protein